MEAHKACNKTNESKGQKYDLPQDSIRVTLESFKIRIFTMCTYVDVCVP